MDNNTINAFRNEYFFLSNFYECPVTYKGVPYTNTESAFQAQKCKTEDERLQFSPLNPTEAKKLGRRVSLRPDWEDIKVKEMEAIVRCKFEQNPDLKEKLIATRDAYLEEGNAWEDRVWGTTNGQGANLLGQILMKTREDFIKEDPEQDLDLDYDDGFDPAEE